MKQKITIEITKNKTNPGNIPLTSAWVIEKETNISDKAAASLIVNHLIAKFKLRKYNRI